MEKNKKRATGVVTSDKMDKSRVVSVIELKKHPLYGKYVKRKKKFMVHDQKNQSHTGDKVLIEESIPVSKNKSWKLVEIIEKLKD